MPPVRKFPKNTLEDALRLAQKIQDENAGQPIDRLLLADALGLGSGSSNYRYLLSSARTYGLTEGTEKAKSIELTELGKKATGRAGAERMAALRQSAATPEIFGRFYERYDHARLPSETMLPKLLVNDFGVAEKDAEECAITLITNGKYVDIIRDISGKACVMLDAPEASGDAVADNVVEDADGDAAGDGTGMEPAANEQESGEAAREPAAEEQRGSKPIFVGHGTNTAPMEQVERILNRLRVPFKRAMSEPNLGRPIPGKVKETMESCGSAILIFTRDAKYLDEEGNEVWRPSENVVHELGAASFAYGDRIVIFKEEGVTLASNFSSIGYIEFTEGSLEDKTADLLQELIGFGLLTVTPAG